MTPLDRSTWPEVLDRREMAVVFRCSTQSIDRMRSRGELPALLSAHPIRWSKADVCRWLDFPRERRGLRRVA